MAKFTSRTLDRWLTALVIGAALAVRLFYLAGIEAYPKFEHIKNRLDDQVVFDAWAKSTASGEVFDYRTTGHEFAHWVAADPGVYPQAPLYPFFVAGFYWLAGYEYDGLRILQMVFGALACGLFYRLARRFLRPSTALLCAFGLAFYGPQVFYEGTMLRAALFTAIGLLALQLLYRLQDALWATASEDSSPVSSRWKVQCLAGGAGVALAAGVLMRPNSLLFAVLALVWLAWVGRARRHVLKWTLLGLVLPLLPIMAINTARSGHLAFLSSNGPYIFFIGNVHDATGTSAGPSPYYFQVKERGEAADVHLLSEALSDIRRYPGRYLTLQLDKLLAFFGPRETPNNLSFEMALETNPRLHLATVRLAWILPLAGLGLFFARRREHMLLHLFLWSYAVSTVLFYVLARLRLPVVPVLLILAGLALEGMWRGWTEGRRRLWAVPALLAVTVSMWLLSKHSVRHRPVDYAMAAAAYTSRAEVAERDGDGDLARQHYGRALALNPQHRGALAKVFEMYPESPLGARLDEEVEELLEEAREQTTVQDLDAAEVLLRRAIDLEPGAAEPYHYLSNVYFLRGDTDRAMQQLEEAVAREPRNELYRRNLTALRQRIAQ